MDFRSNLHGFCKLKVPLSELLCLDSKFLGSEKKNFQRFYHF